MILVCNVGVGLSDGKVYLEINIGLLMSRLRSMLLVFLTPWNWSKDKITSQFSMLTIRVSPASYPSTIKEPNLSQTSRPKKLTWTPETPSSSVLLGRFLMPNQQVTSTFLTAKQRIEKDAFTIQDKMPMLQVLNTKISTFKYQNMIKRSFLLWEKQIKGYHSSACCYLVDQWLLKNCCLCRLPLLLLGCLVPQEVRVLLMLLLATTSSNLRMIRRRILCQLTGRKIWYSFDYFSPNLATSLTTKLTVLFPVSTNASFQLVMAYLHNLELKLRILNRFLKKIPRTFRPPSLL